MKQLKGTDTTRIRRFFKKLFNGQIFVIVFPDLAFGVLSRRYQNYIKKLAVQGKPFIVQFEYGGLGDQIVWSAVPEALFKKYGVKTQISLQSPFRSEEIKEFVWGKNSYVSFTSEPGKTISMPHVKHLHNYNEIVFGLFGLTGPMFSMSYHPSSRPELAQKVVCDLTAGPSSAYNDFGTQEFWDAVVAYLKEHYQKEDLVLIEPTSTYPDKRLLNYVKEQMGLPTVSVASIMELTDVLCSAKDRVLLDSGPKSIAAAYGKHSTVLLRGFVNMYFKYPENDYIKI